MKYLLMIYGNQEEWSSIPAEEWPEAIAEQDADMSWADVEPVEFWPVPHEAKPDV